MVPINPAPQCLDIVQIVGTPLCHLCFSVLRPLVTCLAVKANWSGGQGDKERREA